MAEIIILINLFKLIQIETPGSMGYTMLHVYKAAMENKNILFARTSKIREM